MVKENRMKRANRTMHSSIGSNLVNLIIVISLAVIINVKCNLQNTDADRVKRSPLDEIFRIQRQQKIPSKPYNDQRYL